ncbi:hypothetical protein B0H13DRAFT_1883262 [Mycena leptocephala]|nr:hypothetical protein B0H13DRAFT_1883262 [Mycena leptocephala]
MANLTRSVKSASDWTLKERLAYHIRVDALPPAPPKSESVPGSPRPSAPRRYSRRFLSRTVRLHRPIPRLSRPRNDAGELHPRLRPRNIAPRFLRAQQTRIVHTLHHPAHHLWLTETTVCLLHCPTTLVLLVPVTESNTALNTTVSPGHRSRHRRIPIQRPHARGNGLEPLGWMMIPCISISGTRAAFYLVPVTRELSTAVACGEYPARETVVSMCVTVAGDFSRASEGMEATEYRRVALGRLLAFRTLARDGLDLLPLMSLLVRCILNASDLLRTVNMYF